jgi:hypothetical protein
MELDDLKTLLQAQDDYRQLTPDDLRNMLGKKSKSIIAKLMKSIRFELLFCIIGSCICAAIILSVQWWVIKVYVLAALVMILLFIPLHFYLLKTTNKLGNTALPVKENLVKIASIIALYKKRYLQFTIAMMPVWTSFACILSYSDNHDLTIASITIKFWAALFVLLYFVVTTIGIYFFTKWYLKKLYGNYLDQLTQLITELQE